MLPLFIGIGLISGAELSNHARLHASNRQTIERVILLQRCDYSNNTPCVVVSDVKLEIRVVLLTVQKKT